ncbi:hypothetical protein [Hoeflea sp.]|uniref:hypothetical protein n=1 Tax=Hoeflea sp. TaxID=1940281 RepID=UPI003A9588CB
MPERIDRNIIRPSLELLITKIAEYLEGKRVFRSVSQAQAVPVANSMAAWVKSGEPGTPPVHSDAALRASIYNQSMCAQQLIAFCSVSRLACYEHSKIALHAIDDGFALVPLSLIRGLIERAALAENVRSKLSEEWLEEAKKRGFHEVLYETKIVETIGKSLYGTRVDWQELAQSDFANSKHRELEYKPKEQFLDVSAGQVLSHIDKLSKRVPGCRLAYDVLCEFLHPNVGDLFATTTQSSSNFDAWGTRHLKREFTIGRHDFSGALDMVECMRKTLEVTRSVIELLPEIFSELDKGSEEISRMNRKSMHRVTKRQKHLFRGNDWCPCLSGLTVKNCRF